MVFENGVKNIQAAAYNGARMVHSLSQFSLVACFFEGTRENILQIHISGLGQLLFLLKLP